MPQEFHVLRCYSCGTFQVHIVKKSNKWDCKMCGEKQSVKKVYGNGTGKECRLHVQTLNEKRMLDESGERSVEESEDNIYEDQNQQAVLNSNNDSQGSSKTSKWGEYIVEETITVDEVCEDDGKFTFERPKKRKSFQRNVSTNRAKKFKSKMLNNDTEKCEEVSDKSTKIHTNYLSKKKSSLIVENNSDSKNINSKFNTLVLRNDTDIKCTSSPSNITTTTKNTNKINVSKLINPKKSKWDNYITETECETEVSSQETNIFNTTTDCENLDDILDIQM